MEAPAAHGEVLVYPPPEQARTLLEANRRLLTQASCRIGGVPLSRLRSAVRARLAVEGDGPVVAAGHQPEFMHPGVWAKFVAVRHMARQYGARGVHLVVDSDAVPPVALRVPEERDGEYGMRSVEHEGYRHGMAYEDLPADRRSLADVEHGLRALMGSTYEQTPFGRFREAYRRAAEVGAYVPQMRAAMGVIDGEHAGGLREVRVSEAFDAAFVVEMVREAPRFAAAYNTALRAYRRERGIRGSRHPLPDLRLAGDVVELPLWVSRQGSPRRRLLVRCATGERVLLAEEEPLGAVGAKALSDAEQGAETLRAALGAYRVRPRAVALTMWARLVLADLFVHGIGGAAYDAITDTVIRDYFGMKAPAFVCVSATLWWRPDVPAPDRSAEVALWQRRRRVLYNPQEWLNGYGPASEWVVRRREAAARSAYLARHRPEDHAARRAVFEEIRRCNAAMHSLRPDLLDDVDRQIEQVRRWRSRAEVLHRRDYFVGFYPLQWLADLAGRIASLPWQG